MRFKKQPGWPVPLKKAAIRRRWAITSARQRKARYMPILHLRRQITARWRSTEPTRESILQTKHGWIFALEPFLRGRRSPSAFSCSVKRWQLIPCRSKRSTKSFSGRSCRSSRKARWRLNSIPRAGFSAWSLRNRTDFCSPRFRMIRVGR